MIKKYVNQNYPKTLFAVSLICVGNMLGTLTAAAAPTDSPYMPGTILETERTLADSQVLFDHSGNYTISNTNNNTLQINAGSSGLLKVDNGETIVVNGNIKINQQGFSQSFWSGYDQVANGGKLIVNGDFYWDQTWDGSTWYNLRENFNVKGVADFNGKLTIINDVGTIGGTTSQTTLNAVGGTVNVNGDAYIYNKVGNYISSGANAVYSMNGGIINFNGEKTRIMAVSNQPDSISAKNDTNHPFSKTQVNINSQTTQILGSIDIAGFGQVNAVLTGRESYWYGGEKNAGYWIFPTTGVLNVTVKDGAEWGYFGDHTHYAQGKGLTALILENGGIVNMYDDYLQQNGVITGWIKFMLLLRM